MIEAAVAIESLAKDLRHMSRPEILDPLERVTRNGQVARRLEEIATLIRETVAAEPRATNQATTCPRERRRVIARKGRLITVESRSAS